MRSFIPFAFALALTALAGCSTASPDEAQPAAPATADADLTQQSISKMSSAELEAVRSRFVGATEKKSDLSAFAAGVKWGTKVKLGKTLSKEQLDFLATALLREDKRGKAEVPYAFDLHVAEVTAPAKLSEELRVADAALDTAIEAARKAGYLVARYTAAAAPKAKPTAGALLLLDMPHQEALVLYARSGPAPLSFDCQVTTMHSYEFEEALSKDEYPNVSAQEVPLTGDVTLDVGGNATYSNAEAAAEKLDYTVVARREGSAFVFEASGEFYDAKLVVEGTTGTVYGDRDGNKRWNKAATVACKVLGATK